MTIDQLLTIMRMLRDPDHGCPWDLKQSFQTIAPHTLEEAYEVVDAIEEEDYGHLRNELGDLLFQVVFYAQLGKETGQFEFADVVTEIGEKLLRRHPHVFPEGTIDSFGSPAGISAKQVEANWEEIKEAERREMNDDAPAAEEDSPGSVLDDVPVALPSLIRARKIQKRAATVGFDWPDSAGPLDKLKEEVSELEEAMKTRTQSAVADELGDVLFTVVNLARHLGQDPERCLRASNRKFERRFRQLESLVRDTGETLKELSLEELEARWQQLKSDAPSQ